jgi:phosphoribosyl 1,2-cyclic phosphodiesterase
VADSRRLSVRFWGVRGSIACAGHSYERYGGNTSCIEVLCGDERLIFDAGTGLRALGKSLEPVEPVEIDLFLSHSHLDHIFGLPFFPCLFNPDNRVRLWAGHLLPERRLKEVLGMVMADPLFPVPPEVFAAQTEYRDFRAGEILTPRPGIRLVTIPLNHPNGATGYRIEFAGKSICYVTDTEHRKEGLDRAILNLVRGTDLFIYDATYTDLEYPQYIGWGHSTWQEGVRLAEAAKVRQLVLFHHDPAHDDVTMARIEAEAAAARPGTIAAREGMTLEA